MTLLTRALRGATTLDEDTPDQVMERTGEMVRELLARNDIDHDQIVSLFFTATADVNSAFPAAAARAVGINVPLLCARELEVGGATPRCIRVLMHFHTDRSPDQLRHVYLHGASGLQHGLPG